VRQCSTPKPKLHGPTGWSLAALGRAAPQALEDEPTGNAGHPAALAPAADLLALDVRSEDAAPEERWSRSQ
jgi:hypothetical protein